MTRLRSLLFAALAATACTAGETPPEAASAAPQAPALPEGNFIVNLYDAFGHEREGLTHDFGFSALVRYEGEWILFDAGTNADVLRSNVEALGLRLEDVDVAVASHSHFDHVNGFDYLFSVNPDVRLYFPADVYWGADLAFDLSGREPGIEAELPVEQRYFGGETTEFVFDQSGRFWNANVEFVSEHAEIAPGLRLVATRSPFLGYFSRYPSRESGPGGEGEIRTSGLPELSLSVATEAGDVLLVGCSHSLVETIVRTAREVVERPIALVYGGYHLLPYGSEEIRDVATRLRDELGVAEVAPAHCTGHAGFRVFREVFGERYRFAGLGSTTPIARAAAEAGG